MRVFLRWHCILNLLVVLDDACILSWQQKFDNVDESQSVMAGEIYCTHTSQNYISARHQHNAKPYVIVFRMMVIWCIMKLHWEQYARDNNDGCFLEKGIFSSVINCWQQPKHLKISWRNGWMVGWMMMMMMTMKAASPPSCSLLTIFSSVFSFTYTAILM